MLKNSINIRTEEATKKLFLTEENKYLLLAKNFVLVIGFALLTGISANLKVEIGTVPITMQTLTVLLAPALLGKKKAVLSQAAYLLGGLLGIPWFSRGGGLPYILSPTFGYIIGFIGAVFIAGLLLEKGLDKNWAFIIITMLIGNLVIYLAGVFWLSVFVGTSKALAVGLYPFILGDLLKVFLASLIIVVHKKI